MLPKPSRLTRAAAILLPLLAGTLAMWLLETSKLQAPPAVHDIAGVAPTRLVVFWIDSLAREEAENPQLMPRMHARIARDGALHGPVRACADAVSVPCFTAMITGVDRFSAFALGRNFGGQKGALEGSVLRALQDRDKRIGYLGVPMFKDVLDGLELKIIKQNAPDVPTIHRALDLLERERLDLVIVHMHETDDHAHRLGPSSATYRKSLRAIDLAIDEARARLRPSDHIMIMGDHGHTEDGRHFAGLDVPTYAAFFGPLTRRNVLQPMAISDYGAIWAQLFGVHFGARTWVDDYFENKPVVTPAELPSLPTGAPTPLWAALLCVGLAALTALSRPVRAVIKTQGVLGVITFLLAFAVPLTLGALWMQIRPLVSFLALWKHLALVVATGALGAAILHRSLGAKLKSFALPHFTLLLLGALLLAIPTVYKYGGAFAAMTWLGVGIVLAAARELGRGQTWNAAGIAALWIPLFTIYNPAVRNFSVRWFPVYSEWIPQYALLACVLWVFVALMVPVSEATWGRRRVQALGVGMIFAALRGTVPAWWFAVPCALAAPLCFIALRKPSVASWALACSMPALWFFAEGDAIALAPTAAALLLWSALPRVFRADSPLLRALVLLCLLWLTFWAAMGSRITGVTFNFFFAWLPADVPVTRTWAPHALYTLSKYLLPPALGLLLALRTTGPALFEARPLLEALGRARLALVIAFMSAFSFASPDAGPFITADIVQEAALWMIIVAVIAAFPRPDDAQRASTAVHLPLPRPDPVHERPGAIADARP